MDFAKNNPGMTVGGGAAIQGGLGYLAAKQQNSAIQTSMDAAREAAILNMRDASMQTGQQIQERRRLADQVEGRIRVAFGGAGQGTSGSAAAILNQNVFDEGADTLTATGNLGRTQRGIASQYEATISQLEAQSQNPLLAGFLGALQGATQSLMLVGAAS